MLRKTSRGWAKNVLSFTKIKLLYSRIVFSRYTTVFFWAGLINFIIGVSLQGLSFHDHMNADSVVFEIFASANLNETNLGLPLLQGTDIFVCNGIPGQPGVRCNDMPFAGNGTVTNTGAAAPLMDLDDMLATTSVLSLREEAKTVFGSDGQVVGVTFDDEVVLDMPCVISFVWLSEMLRDAGREDIATLTFQIWLMTLALVTLLNESLPHLGTVFIGHVLLTGWSAFRISESFNLRNIYETGIVHGRCQNYDPLGGWWDLRMSHAIPMVVHNVVALIVMGGIGSQLFKVYSKQTFSRVGAAPEVHHIYKLVLFMSVLLQLTGFFSLAAAAIWIDKISFGPMEAFTTHIPLYLTGFIIMTILSIPWLVVGWACIRRESRRGLAAFFGMSTLLLSISIAMFASPHYRFVFDRWPFFATLTVTAFVLLLATVLIGVACAQNFGKGLTQYLNVADALEGADFTPVMFPTGDEKAHFEDDDKLGYKGDVDPEKGVRKGLPVRKSSLLAPRPSLPHGQQPRRPPSFMLSTPSMTKIMSPTPAFLRDVQAQPLSPPPTIRSAPILPVAPTLESPSRIRTHKPANSSLDSEFRYGLPSLQYQQGPPGLVRSDTVSSGHSNRSLVGVDPPVLPPIARPGSLLSRSQTEIKGRRGPGLPQNPRQAGTGARPRAQTLHSAAPAGPAYF